MAIVMILVLKIALFYPYASPESKLECTMILQMNTGDIAMKSVRGREQIQKANST